MVSKLSEREIWAAYKKVFIKELYLHNSDNFVDGVVNDVEFSNALNKSTYKEAKKELANVLTIETSQRFGKSYATFKYKLKSNTTNIGLKASTVKNLEIVKNKMGLESYDEVIEYLLEPDFEVTKALLDARNDVQAAYPNEPWYIDKILLHWHKMGRSAFSDRFTDVFLEGVRTGKSTKGRLTKQVIEDLIYNSPTLKKIRGL